ncbi:hypothetical protein [Ornithinibacillus halophilus]|uniref:Uncharacterized protein n=1 Tax=Ornithinibacillus halophilus TaxID=930117 RepID=A0A1M5MZV2_9BACI|nr:hypothetical protein [Ornithinibacillus halophilus]SHG82818.1 hypothetical protein SAMN05216225_106813 [Ornithinibacillus halophilus]
MAKKLFYPFIIAGVVLIWVFFFYNDNFSNQGILDKVTSREGYVLNLVRENEPVKFFIKPEWIQLNENGEKELDIELTEKNNTTIILDGTFMRDDNIISFSFDTSYEMDYGAGRFLYNGIFDPNGTYYTQTSHKNYYLYNENGDEIEIGSVGQGPESAFGFEIESEDVALIKNGFYVEYSGFYLYEYYKDG